MILADAIPFPFTETALGPAAVKLGLILARTAGLFSLYPLGLDVVPARVRLGVAILLSLSLWPVVPAPPPGSLPLQVLSEGAVGLLSALVAGVPLAALEAGMQVSSVSAGLGIASLLNPASQEEVHALTELMTYGAVVIFFAVGGHHMLLLALADSLQRVPPGAAQLSQGSLEMIIYLGSEMLSLALQVAAPVMLVSLGAHLAIAFIARAAPAVNIFAVTLVAVLLVGLMTIERSLGGVGLVIRQACSSAAAHYLLGFPK